MCQMHIWKSEDNFQGSFLTFHHVGSREFNSGCQASWPVPYPLNHLSPIPQGVCVCFFFTVLFCLGLCGVTIYIEFTHSKCALSSAYLLAFLFLFLVLGNQHCTFSLQRRLFWPGLGVNTCNPSMNPQKPREENCKFEAIVGNIVRSKPTGLYSETLSLLHIDINGNVPASFSFSLVLQTETRVSMLDRCYTMKLTPQPNMWCFVTGFFTEHDGIHPYWSLCLT